MTIMYLSISSLVQVVSFIYKRLAGLPSRSLMIPRMPAILDTRLPPNSGPSFNRRSPDGRSTTNVGADLEEGDVKA